VNTTTISLLTHRHHHHHCWLVPLECKVALNVAPTASRVSGSEPHQVPWSAWGCGIFGQSVVLSPLVQGRPGSCLSMPEEGEMTRLDGQGKKWLTGPLPNFCIRNKLVPLHIKQPKRATLIESINFILFGDCRLQNIPSHTRISVKCMYYITSISSQLRHYPNFAWLCE